MVEEHQGFIDPKKFISDYAIPSVPVKLTHSAEHFPANRLWSDEYFLSLDIDDDALMVVEQTKKENRSADATQMHFQDFVKTYNSSSNYMVNAVPEFLG